MDFNLRMYNLRIDIYIIPVGWEPSDERDVP